MNFRTGSDEDNTSDLTMSAQPNTPPTSTVSSTDSPPRVPPFSQPSMADKPPKPPSAALLGVQAWASQPLVASFIAGGVAGAVSRTVVSPLERLKILLQVQSTGQTEYKMSIRKALAKIWREEGFRGMMAGNGTNCVRIVPYSAVQFGSYNFYKRVSLRESDTHDG